MTISRRTFLRTSAATAAGLAAGPALAHSSNGVNCIFLMLVGGPSQLDTWDPKPDAPTDVRGPYRPIPTRVPGLRFTELFPRMAAMADRFAVVRSMHHEAAPIHETGHQLLQTGRLAANGREAPHFGALVSARSRISPADTRRRTDRYAASSPIAAEQRASLTEVDDLSNE